MYACFVGICNLVRVFIIVIMGMWSELSARVVCHVVRLYSVVVFDYVFCCSEVSGTLVSYIGVKYYVF